MYVHILVIDDDNCSTTVIRWRNYERAIIVATNGLKKMKTLIHCTLPSLMLAKTHPPHSPLVMKVRSRSSSVLSGASTPGGGTFNSLSERDLQKADAALSQVNGNRK